MKVFKSKYAEITYDETKKRLIQKWYGFPRSIDFRDAIDTSVRFSNAHEVTTILSDTMGEEIITKADAEYAASIMPILLKNGLKAFAFVVSENEYTQFAVDHFSNQAQTKVVKHFINISEAIKWLDTVAP